VIDRFRRMWKLGGLGVVALVCVPGVLRAQLPPGEVQGSDTTRRALRLLLGCEAKPACDADYVRTELPWLGYVRDRADAEVQVISTTLGTGAGGVQVTLRFLGLRSFAGMDDEIRYTTPPGASVEEQRREFVRVLGIGLARYLARTSELSNLGLTRVSDRGQAGAAGPDPWDYWLYKLSVYGWITGESQSSSREVSGSFTISRITPASKVRLGATGSESRSRYRLSDSSEYISRTRSYSARGLAGLSVGRHFSVGLSAGVLASTRQNIDWRVRGGAVLEFDFFPYEEYSRRHLVLSYSPGVWHANYADTTIYNVVEERRWEQNYSLWFSAAQSWGSAYAGVDGSSFFNDLGKNRFSVYGGLSVRVMRGLDFSVNGSYSRVRDQVNLARGGATDEEILLQIRELQTSYTYEGYVSLGYSWGSLFNNVVNPRLEGGGGGRP